MPLSRANFLLLVLLVPALPAMALEPPGPEPFTPALSPNGSKLHMQDSIVPFSQHMSASQAKLSQARILGWIRDYDQSLDLYQEILEADPDNKKARREAARTAYWAKRNELSDSLYRELFTPAVDTLLARRLSEMADRIRSSKPSRHIRQLIPEHPDTTVFKEYESLRTKVFGEKAPLSSGVQRQVQDILRDLRPEYVWQKKAWLEHRAKQAMWNKRFIPSMYRLLELLHLEPKNQEAWFDLAQTQCVLGLCDLEAETYVRLLDMEPRHSLARRALIRQEARSSPALQTRFSWWEEEGRGELAQMSRQRSDMRLDVPVFCRHDLGLTYSRYREDPKRHAGAVTAHGLGFAARTRINEFWSGDFSFRLKDYQDKKYENQESGHLGVRFNAWDAAHLYFSFQRENVLPNAFALEQGIQRDRWRSELSSSLSHALSARLGGEYLDFSDGNSGMQIQSALGYVITEHPREFKITLSGEYRDTQKESLEIWSEQNELINISHPYWTPQDYLGSALTLEWRHDLSEFQFCGSKKNIYDLQFTVGTDTDSNPSIELKGTYTLDFGQHWGLYVQGMIHESKDWDARSLVAGVQYRF